MKLMHLLPSSTFALFLAAGCQQIGQPRTPTEAATSLEARFDRLDKDGDRYITWVEAEPSRRGDFRSMDKNLDGALERSEFTGALPFDSFDADADGSISMQEFLGTHKAMFLKFDEDRDGRISLPEFGNAQRAAGR